VFSSDWNEPAQMFSEFFLGEGFGIPLAADVSP
jgi:hypothetical protein